MPFDERYMETAEKLEQSERDYGVEQARMGDNLEPEWDGDTAYCAECGNENTERTLLGYGRCIHCQERAERWGK